MIKPKNILEDKWIFDYLKKRNFLKAKKYILEWHWDFTNFKERKPSWSNIFYFRINKQYRAFWSFNKDWDLIIFKISDHS